MIDETDVEAVVNLGEYLDQLSENGCRQVNEATVRQRRVNPPLGAPDWDTGETLRASVAFVTNFRTSVIGGTRRTDGR